MYAKHFLSESIWSVNRPGVGPGFSGSRDDQNQIKESDSTVGPAAGARTRMRLASQGRTMAKLNQVEMFSAPNALKAKIGGGAPALDQ